MGLRFVGIDLGAETVKVVEITRDGADWRWTGRWFAEHGKRPGETLRGLLGAVRWEGLAGAAATGRLSRQLTLPRVPAKLAQTAGFRFLDKADAATLVSIGGHGFSVLELRDGGTEIFRENSRCSQGTGNFLRQLVQRFGLTIDEASAACATVEHAAPLSGRCPVILKTDMTHLANKGEDRGPILAGLYDAVCENVQVLIKPRTSPRRVMLIGGVSRSARVRRNFARFLAARGMELIEANEEEALFLEALGAAVVAAEREQPVPAPAELFAAPRPAEFEVVPPLRASRSRVRRMVRPDLPSSNGRDRRLILGFDIGSTGSKMVALDTEAAEPLWEGYIATNGDPVGAAQTLMRRFVEGPAGNLSVLGCAATGSGREIVGSLLATCYGADRVYVLNEIAAHAEGALHCDPRVDTIFEIGGQDAKYIRLAAGRVIDAAMNEACSAGTGSFIEEQGRKFSGVDGVVELGEQALASEHGVSLGQHCSVFMAEVIDEAVAAGIDNRAIIAGLYDSVVQNYLNRVKGCRSVGEVIFCQGMPFSADALAAAVARQTGSEVIVPPNPGTVGALGIALLARKAIPLEGLASIEPRRFLATRVARKDVFVCKSKQGCGGAGNRCRIDRLTTLVDATTQRFTWGGGCSLWDRSPGKKKLPDRAPNPFRSREELVDEMIAPTMERRGRPTLALTDEFQLKGLFPFFATYLSALGFDLVVHRGADQSALKRGIEGSNVPFCAPMQQFHGLVGAMASEKPDRLFLPMLRDIERSAGEPHAKVCPVVQGSPDVLRWDLGKTASRDLVSPIIDIGVGNIESREFMESCRGVAASLGLNGNGWEAAFQKARDTQLRFDAACLELGREALAYCREHGIVPIVVLGRTYTIYNKVLNSNVPAIVREQGAMAIPVDCYPVDDDVPVFEDIYWGHGQRSLRAAHQIRRSRGVYSVWCSNYSCGPDSFSLHFYNYIMQGRPFAVIETDGHSGDAGTKTRVEAFLHCVAQDIAGGRNGDAPNDFRRIEQTRADPADIRAGREVVLFARMGPGADVLAAVLNGAGIPAESLPMPDRESVRIGRRHTSGTQCVPMCITVGSLLQRLERERDTATRFAYLLPRSTGPCRFGVYNLLHKIVLERLGWNGRVRLWSPVDNRYTEGMPAGLFGLAIAGWTAIDVLLEALHHVRPVEARPGAAETVHRRAVAELLDRMRREASREPTLRRVLLQATTGKLFGCARVLRRAAREFAAVKSDAQVPTVGLVGEIYVRCDPFANDFVIEKLESRGIRVQLAPFSEWLEYAEWCGREEGRNRNIGALITRTVLYRCQEISHGVLARRLGWHRRTTVAQALAAAAPYLRTALHGEAVLTLGAAVHEWRSGGIDGVVNVGPLECMPTKLAETQLFHVAEREGLPSLTIPFNGDPLDPEVLDNFAFEVHRGFRRRHGGLQSLATHGRRSDG